MYQNSATGLAIKNARRSKTTGTVAILLTLLEDGSAAAFARAYAGKVLADLGAVDALPTLRRLAARLSSDAMVRAAAREAFDRITRECQAHALSRRQGSWRRLGNHAAPI